MGFWNTSGNNTGLPSGWQLLTSVGQLDNILKKSNDKPVVIFKHSTRCGISMAAKRRLEKGARLDSSYSMYYLDLLAHRDVSNAVADITGVVHQSPQLIVMNDGNVVAHGSHEHVTPALIESNL